MLYQHHLRRVAVASRATQPHSLTASQHSASQPHSRGAAGRPGELGGIPDSLTVEVQQAAPGSLEEFPTASQ